MNSFTFIQEAIEYEIDRQIDVLENGEALTKKHEAMIQFAVRHLFSEQKKMLMIIDIFLSLIYCHYG